MNERELSEKLDELAGDLDEIHYDHDDLETELHRIAQELRKLSNQNYAPGNGLSWDAVKPVSNKKGFTQSGKKTPF